MISLEGARQIADLAHDGQTRWSGEPYLRHPLRVAESLRDFDERAQIVGTLHDVMEDNPAWTAEILARQVGDHLAMCALELLKHQKGTPYEIYVARLAINPIARIVKVADITDNLRDSSNIPAAKRPKYLHNIREEYEPAMRFLKSLE